MLASSRRRTDGHAGRSMSSRSPCIRALESPAAGLECDFGLVPVHVAKQHVGTRQGGMAAKIDFARGREPAQLEMPLAGTKNAVSDRLFSFAIDCIKASGSHAGRDTRLPDCP